MMYLLAIAEFDWNRLFRPDIVWVFIPIVAIFVGGVLSIMKQMNKHEQRMAMIKRGLHPDNPSAASETEHPPA